MDLKKTVLGIELGSTRIKALLLNETFHVVAAGEYQWENQMINGVWTYSLDHARKGMQCCYKSLKEDLLLRHGTLLTTTGAIGISGMMHGYLPFDCNNGQLATFRTWRNVADRQTADFLSELFHFNIPQRWSIAHLYQAIKNGEEHVKDIAFLTTLAGYIHFCLTGKRVVGIGEASGMFPIDLKTGTYDQEMLSDFEQLVRENGISWNISDILPKVLPAGEEAGYLTKEGALLLDPSGDLVSGIPFAPPEGDAGTGMTATNALRPGIGNVSAGTSDFAMVVVDKQPKRHAEIDMVTTPSGAPVAMVHCNNCTSDINAWVDLFRQFAVRLGVDVDKGKLFTLLFQEALKGDFDGGGLMNYNFLSGEQIVGIDEGRPLFCRTPDSSFTLSNFMRVHLYSALASLKIGLEILTLQDQVNISRMFGHGGFFKTQGVGARVLSAAIGAPVSVMETAAEGGPYGMALLAAYRLWHSDGEPLEDFLERNVFSKASIEDVMADTAELDGFNRFLNNYKKSLCVEAEAVRTFRN